MNRTKLILFCLCLVFTTSYGNGTKGENKISSAEIIGDQNTKQTKCVGEKDCDIDYINSNETGPLDSHEAMNTRELKTSSARNKRSTEVDKKAFRNMLLGLVHKKSEDMKDEDDQQKFQSDASELLLELMVRIAAHPQQWDEVHDLLQKIDTDILTSKKILTDIQNTATTTSSPPSSSLSSLSTEPSRTETTTEDEVQKLIILLDNEKQYSEQKNASRNWPNLDDNTSDSSDNTNNLKQKTTTQNNYPWSSKPKNSTREFEFAYHRVTGLPLPYRSNYDKARARNAYVAVSVIAPKSRDVEKEDNLLEDELRQLKPWSHEENLSKMENIRKKWFIRQDSGDEKHPTVP